jgi:diguanylate cyclase (GGDEF)-like protein
MNEAMNVRRLVYGLLATNVLALTVPIALVRVGAVGHGVTDLHQQWITMAAIFTAAACCLLGALHHRSERLAWLILTGGVGAYGTGQLYYSLVLAELANPPYPSLADPFWLALYPAIVVCIALLLRARQRQYQALLWVDGLIVGLGVAAVAAALVYPTIVASLADADPAAVTVTLAYPSGDLLVVVLTMTVFGLAGWRPGRAWLVLGAGLLITTATDTALAWSIAHGQLILPDELFSGWGIGMTLLALAAWQPPQPQTEVKLAGHRALFMPTAFALAALVLLIYGNVNRLSPIAVVLATATLAAAIARGVLTFREARALAGSHELAHTDPLTTLPNRRALKDALEAARDGTLLALYDLDGFKQYNDRFGHHEGDLMLTRLANRLADAVRGKGQAFRLAGDEFCVLTKEHHTIQEAAGALTESGTGFAITASYGIARLHEDGATGSDALRVADERMYRQKFTRGTATAELRVLPRR